MIFENKSILVTGGTGSLGKVLVRRILSGEMGRPKKLIVFSRDEAKQNDMRMVYLQRSVSTDEIMYKNFLNVLEFRIGDVRDYSSLAAALKNVDIVINAAALKQVPACEYFPEQAVMTNCLGAANLVRAIGELDLPVETVVGVSTDKACKPVNVMGMTKALQEKILIAANITKKDTRYLCVRYGNVLASRGSVIPLFHYQIKCGGPVTITLPNMTRFLLTLNEAVDTIFEAIRTGRAGDTYIPMAPSATVLNIAKALIGDRSIEIRETGIRPGEKIHEVLVSDEECHHTIRRGNFYVIESMLPELSGDSVGERPLEGEFSSGIRVGSLEDTVSLLKANDLMIGTNNLAEGGELLR
jgi:FlaA1/EpsC-like NDP-sugar epimerase